MELFLLLSSSLLSLLLFMTKIKRWVLVLSSVTIGSLRGSGFAAWKISNPIKNETSFVVDADGDATEAESSYVKINRVALPHLRKNGFQRDGINTPNAWNVSGNRDPLGYPIVLTGTLKVNLTLSHAQGELKLVFASKRTNGTATDRYNLFRAVSSVTSSDSELSFKETQRLPATPTEGSVSGEHSAVFSIPASWSSLTKTVDITYSFDLNLIKLDDADKDSKTPFAKVVTYTRGSNITLTAAFASEVQA